MPKSNQIFALALLVLAATMTSYGGDSSNSASSSVTPNQSVPAPAPAPAPTPTPTPAPGIKLLLEARNGMPMAESPQPRQTQRGSRIHHGFHGYTLNLPAMQTVVGGGTNPDYDATDTEQEGLTGIGTRRLRLINVDNNLLGIGSDGTLQLQWSWKLNHDLDICRARGWVPHIIIGHIVPAPLALHDPTGRAYGPSSWALYDQYIAAFLDYVIVAQGFTETEWEVGNEMNTPSQNWVAPTLPTSPTDPAGFTAYSQLYSHIATDVATFRQQHPAAGLRIGGPAAEADWAAQFIDFVGQQSLPADFVSLHVYGNQITGATLKGQIHTLRRHIAAQRLTLSIGITEWGPSTDSQLSFAPVAGSFALDFASTITQVWSLGCHISGTVSIPIQ